MHVIRSSVIDRKYINVVVCLKRLKYSTQWRDEMFGAAVILMLRLRQKTSNKIPITWLTVHRLFATALLIAQKDVDSDRQISNADYATVCGMQPFGVFEYSSMLCPGDVQ